MRPGRKIIVNGLDINSGEIYRVISTNLFSSAPRSVDAADLARHDGRVFLNQGRFGGRDISIAGLISTTSQEGCDQALDVFKRLLSRGKVTIMVDFPEGYRSWSGYVQNINISRESSDVSRAAYSFELLTDKPAATSSVGFIQFSETVNITTSAILTTVENRGTYIASPVIILSSSSSSSSSSITIGNPESGEYLSFSTSLRNGDTVRIDCDTKQILHGSQMLRPTGTFPTWEHGSGLLEYRDDMSSRQITLQSNYNPKYL